ncbi:acetoacetyl-CoA synthetase [Asanoa ishikariensis]|uniref:Acetoacetyl-CoA synthetase n=1 Tax=Asanoa ishikariensis TaxID=137265 RepID=A0A1H3T178_9ACTN|nr:acetoacetate--CoA ligase [Asanoa ishikariensis]GIF63184.1 acetoacetyl-CoA synthetase [Asanoa ishikariensis]SDZ43638.1 acetoacetyl-CoA synthetase [Asanoa ishikariensis]
MTVIQPDWVPDPSLVGKTRIVRFATWLGTRGYASFDDVTDYAALHAWSVAHPGEFWAAVAEFFEVDWSTAPTGALTERRMPGAVWFPDGTLNFGAHLLRAGADDQDAVVLVAENGSRTAITYAELRTQAFAVAGRLRALGVEPGDRVAAYLPNCVEGVVAFVATALVGAVWAQTGLDYAAPSAADRMAQLEPRVLIAGSGYHFGGTVHDRRADAHALRDLLPGLQHTITVETAGLTHPLDDASTWADALAADPDPTAVAVPFAHPLWVLFTSGTTGKPKGIVHGHGGVLLEQLVSPGLHMDVRGDDVFFWFTTPNWMMWNAQVCGLLHGATIVLYDGRPRPDALWPLVADLGVTVFGTSPGFLEASQRAGLEPGRELDLSKLRLVGVTGSVLPASANAWFRHHVSASVQLGSMSGGTDICGIFVASAPTTPVYDGEISAPALGAAVQVWNADGEEVPAGTPGEMVITEPMPSMPLRFWADPDDRKLNDTYFADFPGVWRHGDLTVRTERGTVVILGRSDATINRHGVRLGSAEIYDAISDLPEVADALVVGVEEPDGGYWLPLFVVPHGSPDPANLVSLLRQRITERASPRHAPDDVVIVSRLPHTRTGKRLEVPVKRILQGADPEQVINRGAVDDPEALDALVAAARTKRGQR